jgi:hypothetical protein
MCVIEGLLWMGALGWLGLCMYQGVKGIQKPEAGGEAPGSAAPAGATAPSTGPTRSGGLMGGLKSMVSS